MDDPPCLPPLPQDGDEGRCHRTGTPNWRCPEPAIPGRIYCLKHYLYTKNRYAQRRKSDAEECLSGGEVSGSDSLAIEPYRPALDFGGPELSDGGNDHIVLSGDQGFVDLLDDFNGGSDVILFGGGGNGCFTLPEVKVENDKFALVGCSSTSASAMTVVASENVKRECIEGEEFDGKKLVNVMKMKGNSLENEGQIKEKEMVGQGQKRKRGRPKGSKNKQELGEIIEFYGGDNLNYNMIKDVNVSVNKNVNASVDVGSISEDVRKRMRRLFESDSEEEDEGYKAHTRILYDIKDEPGDEGFNVGGEMAVVPYGGTSVDVIMPKKKPGRPKGSKNKAKSDAGGGFREGFVNVGNVSGGRGEERAKSDAGGGFNEGLGNVVSVGGGRGEEREERVNVCALMVADHGSEGRKGSGRMRRKKDVEGGSEKGVGKQGQQPKSRRRKGNGEEGGSGGGGFNNGGSGNVMEEGVSAWKMVVVDPAYEGEKTKCDILGAEVEEKVKRRGRPKGSKDKKQRRPKGFMNKKDSMNNKVKKRGRPKGSKNQRPARDKKSTIDKSAIVTTRDEQDLEWEVESFGPPKLLLSEQSMIVAVEDEPVFEKEAERCGRSNVLKNKKTTQKVESRRLPKVPVHEKKSMIDKSTVVTIEDNQELERKVESSGLPRVSMNEKSMIVFIEDERECKKAEKRGQSKAPKNKKSMVMASESDEAFENKVKKRGRPKGSKNKKTVVMAAANVKELGKKVERRGRPKGPKKQKTMIIVGENGEEELWMKVERRGLPTVSKKRKRFKGYGVSVEGSAEQMSEADSEVVQGGGRSDPGELDSIKEMPLVEAKTVRAHSLGEGKKPGRPKGAKNKRYVLVEGVLHAVSSSLCGKGSSVVESDVGCFLERPGSCGNALANPGKMVGESKIERKRPRRNAAKYDMGAMLGINGLKKDQVTMCHQCLKCDKEDVVSCSYCKKKRYCRRCLDKWYPERTRKDVQLACPFCRGNCNCRVCLQENLVLKAFDRVNGKIQLERLLYLLGKIIPLLRNIQEEQRAELDAEARILGEPMKEGDIMKTRLDQDDRVYCDNCNTSIVNVHRSCPNLDCSYDLCLSCCKELREISRSEGVETEFLRQRLDEGSSFESIAKYLNHGDDRTRNTKLSADKNCLPGRFFWITNDDGSIPCPPKTFGGCGLHKLELRCIFNPKWVDNLMESVDEVTAKYKLAGKGTRLDSCTCLQTLSSEVEGRSATTRKAASRENVDDNFLYCPKAGDMDNVQIDHFQMHWTRGEPVIVRDVFRKSSGLSWEPMVMCRAFREANKIMKEDNLYVKAIDCLDWCEVEIDVYHFFKGYMQGRDHSNGWPEILKLKDWPDSSTFGECLPRHNSEFLSMLPYSEYTHPESGTYNLATKLPDGAPRPDLGPKTYIAYGLVEELERGDSVTKLHCDISDAVNVLLHTTNVDVDSYQQQVIHKLQKEYEAEGSSVDNRKFDANKPSDATLDYFADEEFSCAGGDDFSRKSHHSSDSAHHDSKRPNIDGSQIYGGAVWDIFRREDVPKIVEYLKKHQKEFRHINNLPVKSIIHPIHDQIFYLSESHKKQLKEEFNVEPWTFEQHLGEAVLIPAGCPHQVRNRMSCIKVALDFVSPENVQECIRLTEEFRLLPKNHRSKEDKLEVKKMAIYAASSALNDVKELMKDPS